MMKIGVLALQGAFVEHEKMLSRLWVESFQIRGKKDLEKQMDAVILPGGESTAIGKLLFESGMAEILKGKILSGLPVMGTCAGLILLAAESEGGAAQRLATMDIKVKRNAYGRQLGSFTTKNKFAGQEVQTVFIRAPYICEVGKNVEVLSVCDGKIVAARQENQLVTSFHPELTEDTFVHRYFLEKVCICQ